ncbi:MAG: hypothetical protein ABI091_03295 [Ferruginibacter sp.]
MNKSIETTQGINFTRIDNDVNGNPRYVCHFLNLLSEKYYETERINNKSDSMNASLGKITMRYKIALQIAKKIGGKKFDNKQYGGGIVFQSYNIEDTAKRIKEII